MSDEIKPHPASTALAAKDAEIARLTSERDDAQALVKASLSILPDRSHSPVEIAHRQRIAETLEHFGWLEPEKASALRSQLSESRAAHAEAERKLADALATVPPPDAWRSLQAQAAQLRAELTNIAKAKRFDRKRFSDDAEFAFWVQSRAGFTLDHNDAGSGWIGPTAAAAKDARISELESSLSSTQRQLEEAREMLRRVEWGGLDECGCAVCPICEGNRPDSDVPADRAGHRPGCELAALINQPAVAAGKRGAK